MFSVNPKLRLNRVTMTSDDVSLNDLRQRIDAIDEEIHDLIMRRAAMIDDVRNSKGPARAGYYRPAREAEILRRLVRRHQGPFPAQVLVRIWRELVSASVRMQGEFAIAVYSPDGSQALVDLTRDHFGHSAPITTHGSATGVVRSVRDGVSTVGVLPLPEYSQEARWWPSMADAPPDMRPLISARIPFASTGVGVSALVIGNIEHEATGADHSYLLVRAEAPISRGRMGEALAAIDLPVCFLDGLDDAADPTSTLFLVEVPEFVSPDDNRVGALVDAESSPAIDVFVVGGYALPLSPAEIRAEA